MKNQFSSGPSRVSALIRSLTAAALAGPPLMTAHAAVVYSGVRNIIPGNPTFSGVFASVGVDINNSGAAELDLRTDSTTSTSGNVTVTGWGYGGIENVYGKSGGVVTGGTGSKGGLLTTRTTHSLLPSRVSSFASLSNAGSSLPLLGLGATIGEGGFFTADSRSVQWAGGSNGYFGFRFNPTGATNLYGWGRLSISGNGQIMKLLDWAYEDTGAPILAGATAVPEAELAALVMAGLSSAALRRRRQDKTRLQGN